MRFMLTLLLALGSAPALAVAGVLEINHTCAVQTGRFAPNAGGFPLLITNPGSYRLTSNLTLPDENTIGILVNADDVTIDLNGFAVIGPVEREGSRNGAILPRSELGCHIST